MAKNVDEKKMVWMGRIVAVAAIFISLLFTWEDLLGIGGEGGFTFIQKYTGFISPGVFAMFILGYVLETNNRSCCCSWSYYRFGTGDLL